MKAESGFQLFAYGLMGNYVHPLLKETAEPLEVIFRRLGASYVYDYNFVREPCNGKHLEDEGARRLTDREAIARLQEVCGCARVQELGSWTGARRDGAIRTPWPRASPSASWQG